ncbi:MAG: hypothetical protein LBP33_02290 [Candidatus Adiutrix sp.]|nr:hypothetical protein [Candidatus Adiutrix sp.]
MKKYVLILAVLILSSGCAFNDWFGGSSSSSSGGGSRFGGPDQGAQQMADAKNSFDQKIKSAQGQSLAQVQKDWGRLERGLSQGGLTVYRWSQTARITSPGGKVAQASSGGQETASCLAMFIVDPYNTVVDATSEGLCLDLTRMPAWKPYVTESTDGRTGTI